MPNNPKATDNLKPMKKGYDPRRNLRGVPKTALEVKKRIEKIGAELLVIREKIDTGETTVTPDGKRIPVYEEVQYELSRIDAMLRRMYSSSSPADRKEILERVAGKVPQAVTVGNPDGSALIPTPETMKPSEIAAQAVLIAAEIVRATKSKDDSAA